MVDPLVVVLGTPFLLAGTVLLWYGGRLAVGLLRRRLQTRTVEATILDASVVESEDGDYEPSIRFRYDHDGRTYESSQVREGRDPPSGSRAVVESFLEPYEEGETVTATLLTSTPGQAVLERSTDRWPYVVAGTITALGIVFTVLGGGVVVSGLVG
jgi:hypothetical protein